MTYTTCMLEKKRIDYLQMFRRYKTLFQNFLQSANNQKKVCLKVVVYSHDNVFPKFWDLGSYDLQNSYLFGAIRVEKKISYKEKQKLQESSGHFTAQFTVNVDGRDVKICKFEFMNVLGLQNSGGRIDHIVKMKTAGWAVVPIKDGRGKHKCTNRWPKTICQKPYRWYTKISEPL